MTFTLGTGAGTGATYTLIGSDTCGGISVTTGTGTSANFSFGQFTFGTNIYANALLVSLIPVNANAQGLSNPATVNAGNFTGGMKQTGFAFNTSSSIADSTTYTWSYYVESHGI